MFGAAVDGFHVTPVRSRQRHATIGLRRQEHHFTETDDQVERRTELVADICGKLGLQAARLDGRQAGTIQFRAHFFHAVVRQVEGQKRTL